MMNRPATFLDRDGILNVDKSYVCRREDFVWIEGAKPAVKALNDAGYLVVVVTNQAGVARGFYDEDAVRSLHEWINEELRQEGAHIDAFYYCPHHRDGVLERYACECNSRKPAPGMILRALREWSICRERSFLIGDKDSDIAAAQSAGLPGHLFKGGNLLTFVDGLLNGLARESRDKAR
jgi:D-glycero-D-manno-heptose 1,7-bisphosphate phosphatase